MKHNLIQSWGFGFWVIAIISLWAGTAELFLAEPCGQEREEKIFRGLQQVRNNIETTILQLQNFERRSSCEEQWVVANWLSKQCIQAGLETSIEKYEFEGKVWPNVIGSKKGSAKKEEYVVLLAHFDSAAKNHQDKAPGADDNGSGIAVLLETARKLQSSQLQRTILFCFFSNEERNSAGSNAFVAQAKIRGMKIHAVLNVDAIGYARGIESFTWSAIQNGDDLREKIQITKKMLTNAYLKLTRGDIAVEVVGREPNRELVKTVAAALRNGYKILNIKEVVSNDCG